MTRISCCLAFVLALASPSAARAAAVPFTGTLSLQFVTLAPIPITGGGVAVVNGSSGVGHLTALALPANAFSTTLVIPVTDPGAAPLSGIKITAANGTAAFAGSGGSGSFGGAMPLAGFAKLCLFGPCSVAVTNISIPLSVVGQGGSVAVSAAVNITVVGAPWTTGTVSIGSITAMGGVSPTSTTDSMLLVTPIVILQNSIEPITPGFAFLQLSGLSVPEPGTLALLGLGIGGLVAVGRWRRA
jgi:hypothetical protein